MYVYIHIKKFCNFILGVHTMDISGTKMIVQNTIIVLMVLPWQDFAPTDYFGTKVKHRKTQVL